MTVERGAIVWEAAAENEYGIQTIAYQSERIENFSWEVIVGYNGIVLGDAVRYDGETWTVVHVSRLGLFGLSKTGQLPYEVRVWPNQVERVEEGKCGVEVRS